MNITSLIIALAMLIGGVFSIATSSIATQCYNENTGVYSSKNSVSNFNFIIVNLVSAILVVLSAIAGIYFAVTM